MTALSNFIFCLYIAGFLLLSQLAQAQTDSVRSGLPHIEYYQHDTYFEKLIRNGEHQEYYTLNTYLNDSSLFRIDNFKLLDPVIVYGYPFSNQKVAVRHGPTKIMYASGPLYLTCEYKMNELSGPFMVFYNDGAIKRREFYKNGRLRESHCYSPDGDPQPCAPFYQLPEFRGNEKKLKDYLETSLQTLVDGEKVKSIRIILTINEIGQITNTTVESGQTNTKLVLAVRSVIQNMPDWFENESNWKPGSIDGVAVSKSYIINAYRNRGFLSVNFYPAPF